MVLSGLCWPKVSCCAWCRSFLEVNRGGATAQAKRLGARGEGKTGTTSQRADHEALEYDGCLSFANLHLCSEERADGRADPTLYRKARSEVGFIRALGLGPSNG